MLVLATLQYFFKNLKLLCALENNTLTGLKSSKLMAVWELRHDELLQLEGNLSVNIYSIVSV